MIEHEPMHSKSRNPQLRAAAHRRWRSSPSTALLTSLRGYRREWLKADALAAVVLLVIAIPEQLATSRLAGMPPITGYYAFVAGTVLFALLGSNPQMSVGADSTIAPLFAVGITRLTATGSPRYMELVWILSVAVGMMVTLVWLLRLGWIAEFLSVPITAGFLGGIAVIIVVHQLPDLLGVPPAGGSTVHRVASTLGHLGHASGLTVAIAAGVFAIVVAAERIDRRIPGALIGLVASTLVVAALGLQAHGVAVLGTVAHAAPRPRLRGVSFSALGKVAPLAGVVALVVVSQSAATTRAFADQEGYEVDVGRDLLGVGAGSIAAGLVGAFPVNASPPRTAAVAAASGRTQAACLAAAVAIAALIPVAGTLKNLPLATLAGVLVFVAFRIFPAGDLVTIARFDRFELALALVTLLTVAIVGVVQGIGVAVGLAILDRTRLSARTHLHVLGRIPNSTSWVPLSSAERPAQLPGMLVVLFATPLWYANASHFREQILDAISRAVEPPRVLVLDAIGMSDIDYSGARVLSRLLDELGREQIAFAVARAAEHLRSNLQRSGLLERIGEHRFFPSVDAAVTALRGESRR